METMLTVLTLVAIIAAVEIWRVLRDIRNALQTRNGLAPGGRLSVLEEALLWAKDISKALEAVVNELDRIGCILGSILADMPSPSPPPRESRPLSKLDRLRAMTEEKSALGGFTVVDRRSFAADGSRNVPSNEEPGAK